LNPAGSGSLIIATQLNVNSHVWNAWNKKHGLKQPRMRLNIVQLVYQTLFNPIRGCGRAEISILPWVPPVAIQIEALWAFCKSTIHTNKKRLIPNGINRFNV